MDKENVVCKHHGDSVVEKSRIISFGGKWVEVGVIILS
jgi:hypothetical protein